MGALVPSGAVDPGIFSRTMLPGSAVSKKGLSTHCSSLCRRTAAGGGGVGVGVGVVGVCTRSSRWHMPPHCSSRWREGTAQVLLAQRAGGTVGRQADRQAGRPWLDYPSPLCP